MSNASTPPRINPSACNSNAVRISSRGICPKSGSSELGK